MLLAVTNAMCQDVAVVPFLWVLPLGLYLLSFIICFDSERWYYRPVFWPLMVGMIAFMCRVLSAGAGADLAVQVGGFALGLFACAMVCHGELVRLRPGPRRLTAFYLMVAAGGALGGVFVTLVAPLIFKTYVELNVGIWLSAAVALAALGYSLWHRAPDAWLGAPGPPRPGLAALDRRFAGRGRPGRAGRGAGASRGPGAAGRRLHDAQFLRRPARGGEARGRPRAALVLAPARPDHARRAIHRQPPPTRR